MRASSHVISPASPALRRTRFCLLGLVALTALAGLAAKPLPVPFHSEFQAENWALDEGFPENSCSGIVAGPDGYLWLGTFRGLVRFNGQTFKPWAPAAMPMLRHTGILTMYRDRTGRIWFSTMDGLVTNAGDTWRRWTADDGWDNAGDYVRSIAENAAGQLVFTRHSGRVSRLQNERFGELPEPPGTGGTLAGLDADGGLHAFRAGHALFFDQNAWRPIEGAPADLGARAVGAGQSRDGHALLICRDELLRLRGGRIVSRVRLTRPVGAFWQLAEEASGALWLSAVDAGVYRIRPDGEVTHFRKTDGLPHAGGTRVVSVAGDGAIWIGSGVGGLTRFRPTRFRYLGDEEGMGEREVLTLTQLADGRILFAPYGTGLRVFEGGDGVQPLRLGVNLPLLCRALLHTRDGALWFGTNGAGLTRLANGSVTREATQFFLPTEKESVHSLFEDSRGRLWVGGERHVLVRDQGGFQRVPVPEVPDGRRRTMFAERRDGAVLLGQENAVFVFDGQLLRPEPIVRLPAHARISTLLVDDRDRLWIGTAGQGLHVWHEGRLAHLGIERGLPGSTIGALVQDDRGHLWFGSGRSVVRADPSELWAAAIDRAHELRVLRFDREDGIRNLDFPFGTQPNVLKDAQGRLWFALIRGATMIDPGQVLTNDRPPPVVIESISFVPDGGKQPIVHALAPGARGPELPAGSRLIRLDYAALDFSAPRKQRFRAALDGEWQDMNGDTTVSFLELPPGRHTLQVQAAGSDGVWNRTGATLSFSIAPFYWQTAWFRALIAFGVMGLVGGTVWFVSDRRTRIAREKLERERRLAEAQGRLALVLENTSDFVAFFDRAGRLTYLNRAGRTLLGLEPAADVTALALVSLQPAWAQHQHAHLALPAVLKRGTWSGETALLQRGGGEVPVSQVLIAHRAPDGTHDFTSMIARDISAAKRHAWVQDALRRLATALTAAHDAPSLGRVVAEACRALFAHDAFFLVLVDRQQAVTQTAHAEDTPPGGSAPEPIAAPIQHFPRSFDGVMAGRPLLLNRDPAAQTEASLVAPWGFADRRSLSLMYAPVRWEDQTIGVLSLQSYTARRYGEADLQQLETLANHCAAAIARLNAEAALRRHEEQLRQSQKLEAVGTLAGGIAHDFNNILTAILGNAELTNDSLPAGHDARTFVDRIRQSSLRARDLVRRILAFSRPQEPLHRNAAVGPVVEEVVTLLRSTSPAHVEIRARLAPGTPPADIDPSELHQVLLNLGTNAVHALDAAPGQVVFEVASAELDDAERAAAARVAPGRYVVVTVRDTGGGIAAEVLPRIFDPFFTTKAPGQGTGLGLSVAHGIIHARGGAIGVVSRPSAGTTFTLHLPVAAEGEPIVPALHPEPARPALPARGRLLFVDDEAMISTVMHGVFTRAGYEVASFTSALEARAAFRAAPEAFDLVLTDLSMPGLNGIALIREIRPRRPDLPIVLFSGYLRAEERAAAVQAGVSEIVEKPVPAEMLLPLVARWLAGAVVPARP